MPRLPKRFTWVSRRTERRPLQGKQECLCRCRRRYDTSKVASQFPRLVFQTRYGGLSCAGGLRRIARFVAHKSSICVAGDRHRLTAELAVYYASSLPAPSKNARVYAHSRSLSRAVAEAREPAIFSAPTAPRVAPGTGRNRRCADHAT